MKPEKRSGPRAAAALLLGALLAGAVTPAAALPVFSHRYGFSCQKCHTTVPQLNEFGRAFQGSGFRLPEPRPTFPLAVKVNLAYSSAPDPTGLPKAIVDEVEVLSGGSVGRATGYFFEQYVVDGGRPGLARDAWLQFDFNAAPRSSRAHLRIGQFELPLPVDIESTRDTLTHYAVYDQQVGANTFNFFDPRIGLDISMENERSGLAAHLVAVEAYDRQTATPRSGVDWMVSLAKTGGDATFTAYHYQGQRHFASPDRFWREGFAAEINRARLTLTGVLQTGHDNSADGAGLGIRSSGGFLEALYWCNPGMGFATRYEGANDELRGLQRRFVFATIVRPRPNMRFTLEDAVSRGHQTLNAALLFSY